MVVAPGFRFKSMNELIEVTNWLARDETSSWRHPNLRQVLLVTQDNLTRIAAKGMNSELFGNMNIAVFTTLDDALAHARSEL